MLVSCGPSFRDIPLVQKRTNFVSIVFPMNFDDVIYLLALLSSIAAGNWIRRLANEELRRLACTALGLTVGLFVSGWQMTHCLVAALVGAISVVHFHPR